MKTRKILAMLLAGAMALTCLAGCGGGSAASWYHCTGLEDQIAEFTRIASGSNMGAVYSGMLSKNLQVYDVSGNGRFIGEPTDLRVGDQVHCLLDSRNRIAVAFVVSRKADAPIFWNVDRKWDSKTSKTTRSANANGVYEILVAVGGEQKYVYTTDWEIANKIDGRAAMCFGLLLDGSERTDEIIKSAMMWDVMGGVARRNWARNENALSTSVEYNKNYAGKGHITIPYIAGDELVNEMVEKFVK